MQQCNSNNRRNCSTDAQGTGAAMPCPRGLFQGVGGGGPFSIFFAINEEDANPPPSLAVDCTLSLGTPSTRQLSAKTSLVPSNYSLRLDLLPSPSKQATPSAFGSRIGGDPLLHPRRCANCDTTSTPLWRNGPRGPKSLCNACGIRYKKEERRAASSTVASFTSSSPSSSSLPSAQQQYLPANYGYRQPWGCPSARLASTAAVQRSSPSPTESAMEPSVLPYLPWQRFNVGATAHFQD